MASWMRCTHVGGGAGFPTARPPSVRPGSGQLLSADRDKVILAARAIITAGERARYAVGGHPARDGNATVNSQLARIRAEVVVKILVDHGVSVGQIEIVPFSVAPEGDRDNQVEIVVK